MAANLGKIKINFTFVELMIKKIVQPPYLQKGDLVAFVAPSSKFEVTKLAKARAIFESWGLQVVIGSTVTGQHHYFSGTDQERLQDLQHYFDDPK